MPTIYCGNNARDVQLLSGNQVLGTRNGCLRKGIGKGLQLPYDSKYAGDYLPIDNRKIYCGNENILPNGYDLMGNLPQCLQKGIGIGKVQKARNNNNVQFPNKYKFIIFMILYVFLISCLFILLYVTKPSFVTNKDRDKDKINTIKLVAYYIPTSILIGVCMIIVYKYI
jgi:hypothetical protein